MSFQLTEKLREEVAYKLFNPVRNLSKSKRVKAEFVSFRFISFPKAFILNCTICQTSRIYHLKIMLYNLEHVMCSCLPLYLRFFYRCFFFSNICSNFFFCRQKLKIKIRALKIRMRPFFFAYGNSLSDSCSK